MAFIHTSAFSKQFIRRYRNKVLYKRICGDWEIIMKGLLLCSPNLKVRVDALSKMTLLIINICIRCPNSGLTLSTSITSSSFCPGNELRVPKNQHLLLTVYEFDYWLLDVHYLLMSGVKPPLSNLLQMTDVFEPKTNKPRTEVLKEHFIGEGRLKPDVALRIIAEGAAVFRQEKCLLDIPQPITG